MTGPALAVVEALLSAPIAWRSPAHLRHDSGLDEAATFCGLEDLEAAGLITHWETDAELTVTLTPIGAARLGVRLIEVGPDEIPRWASPETPEPSPPAAKGIFRDYQALSVVVGPVADPARLVEEAESLALAGPWSGDPPDDAHDRPRFTGRLAGLDFPWSRPTPGLPCPGCGSQVIPEYCVYCDGVETKPGPRPKRSRTRAARRSAQAKANRKSRLKARFS